MYHPRSITDKVLLFIKGLSMGAANKVPGVSGGIVAFVVGFYEEFIYSLQKINAKAFKLLLNGRKSLFHPVRHPQRRIGGSAVMTLQEFLHTQVVEWMDVAGNL